MTIDEFIDILKNSKNKILVSEASNLGKWSQLKHNKESLELFLNYNIAEIEFRSKKTKDLKRVLVCSNTNFIKAVNAKSDSDKKKIIESLPKIHSTGLKNNSSILTTSWNIMKNDYCTIPLNSWKIVNWIEINESNAELINDIIRDMHGIARTSKGR